MVWGGVCVCVEWSRKMIPLPALSDPATRKNEKQRYKLGIKTEPEG